MFGSLHIVYYENIYKDLAQIIRPKNIIWNFVFNI